MPKDYPEKYRRDLYEVELFNASISTSIPEVKQWHSRYLNELGAEPLGIFERYLNSGFVIFGTLMEHPPVDQAEGEDLAGAAARFAACSVVLQRAVLVSNPPRRTIAMAQGRTQQPSQQRQTLFLRSFSHSAQDDKTFVNFVPRGGIEMTYTSDTMWFPLELTSVIQEPASYVVLDLLTPERLDAKVVPAPFQIQEQGRMPYEGQHYHVTRIGARLDAKQQWPDLRIKIAG